MSLARVKTFVQGVVLTATDLNAEFTNILQNAISLVAPLSGNLASGGFKLTNLAAGYATGDAMRFEQNVPATQAEMEAATSLTAPVVSGRQHFHPSAAKAWALGDLAGNVTAGYNISSVTDTGTGYQTYHLTTGLPNPPVSTVLATGYKSAAALGWRSRMFGDTGAEVLSYDYSTGLLTDATATCVVWLGDMA